MVRGAYEFGSVPEWLTDVAALLTQLGSVWFLAVLLVALYTWHDVAREEIALVGATWLTGIGVYTTLKEYFAVPRPDPAPEPALPELVAPAYEFLAMGAGYGFPSGHAVNATIVSVGLAGALAIGPRLARYAGAAAIVATVALTRLILGVQYPLDVVAGVALGLALVLGSRLLVRRFVPAPVTATFALAVGSSLSFVLVSDGDPSALVLFAVALGAFAGWQLVALGRRLVIADRIWKGIGPTVVRGSLAGVAIAPLAVVLASTDLASPYGGAAVAGVGTAAVVASPLLWRPERAWRVAFALAFVAATGILAVQYSPPLLGL